MNTDSIAYKKGVTEFDCGACPECLRKRSSAWALRAVYEARAHVSSCMITLTYDNFVRDKSGKIIGETPVDPNLKVNQRDVQLFIKRLRKWYSTVSPLPIKYIACAEYGSRTHRAHYHCILFGVKFPDTHFYKKSKRGNPIYMSHILTKLWQHGICTVDSINIHSAIARYCTKYCAKTRSDETFMLCSQSIGLSELMKDFNGINYMIDGREYAIPRMVWQKYITDKYMNYYNFSTMYVNKTPETLANGAYEKARLLRESYRMIRDNDRCYIRYLEYWHRRGEQFEAIRQPVIQRIELLDDNKYHNYKLAAKKCIDDKRNRPYFVVAPGSRSGVSRHFRTKSDYFRGLGLRCDCQLPYPSRPNTATDTKTLDDFDKMFKYKPRNALTQAELQEMHLKLVPNSEFIPRSS